MKKRNEIQAEYEGREVTFRMPYTPFEEKTGIVQGVYEWYVGIAQPAQLKVLVDGCMYYPKMSQIVEWTPIKSN